MPAARVTLRCGTNNAIRPWPVSGLLEHQKCTRPSVIPHNQMVFGKRFIKRGQLGGKVKERTIKRKSPFYTYLKRTESISLFPDFCMQQDAGKYQRFTPDDNQYSIQALVTLNDPVYLGKLPIIGPKLWTSAAM